MSATIIGGDSPQFEPEIISDNGRDGISAFQFKVVGRNVSDLYPIDAVVDNVPGQPSGSFRVVRRNLENIVEGLQRLSVSAEGGSTNGLYISEAGYQYNESQEDGLINLPFAQIKAQYKLAWLSASVTVTTNSGGASAGSAESIAKQIIASMPVQVKKDRPANVSVGRQIDTNTILITGSSIEKAGGLWRVRATASKGILPT
jgi:hypothetical protein